jgi:hypothetical protein
MTMINKNPTASVEVSEATAPIEATPPPSAATLSVGIGRAYERFLEMPAVFVLGVMWLAGVALLGSCALVLYLAVSALI